MPKKVLSDKERKRRRDAAQKRWRKKNKKRLSDRGKARYKANKASILARQAEHRKTPERKAYMTKYREKNKDKLKPQLKRATKKYLKKIGASVSDNYALMMLTNPKHGQFKTREEARKYPEAIEIKKGEILVYRIDKTTKQITA